jgi:hypothetical protein
MFEPPKPFPHGNMLLSSFSNGWTVFDVFSGTSD